MVPALFDNDYRLDSKRWLAAKVEKGIIISTTMQLLWTLHAFAEESYMKKFAEGMTVVKLGCRLKNRRLPGVEKADGAFKGYAGFRMDVSELQKHFGISEVDETKPDEICTQCSPNHMDTPKDE